MSKQLKQLNPKQINIIKGKVAGKKNRTIAKELMPNIDPHSAETLVSRELKKVDVKEALAAAFEAHGITLDAAIEPIGKALKATKIVIHGNKEDAFAEEVEDLDLQLKGSDRALKLMGIGAEQGTTNNFIFIAKGQRAKYDIS